VPIYDAMKAMPGVDVPIDGAGGENGLYWFTTSMDPVTYNRSYARSGHWDDLQRSNYHLLPATKVRRIITEGHVAVGVEAVPRDGGNFRVIKARREVILAAGAIHTPHILKLSGIGLAKELQDANIPVVVDLPGVGWNFQDHLHLPNVEFQCELELHAQYYGLQSSYSRALTPE
jgi:choline dehydrogenase-like flavoprotein